jgi:hypothetical protein
VKIEIERRGLACSSLTTSIRSDQLSARFQIWTGVFFRANATKQGGASVPRFLLSLTEFQSHVTRKMPALNNAKPERTIASIALSLSACALN